VWVKVVTYSLAAIPLRLAGGSGKGIKASAVTSATRITVAQLALVNGQTSWLAAADCAFTWIRENCRTNL
jgi:hypothetical protein